MIRAPRRDLPRRGSGRTRSPLGLTLGSGTVGAVGTGLAAVVLAVVLGGVPAGASALAGLVVVVLFFVVSIYLVEVANRVAPSLTLPVGMTVYGVLVAWLGLLAFGTSLPDRLHKAAFAWTVIAAALGWVIIQASAVWRSRLTYVDVPLPTAEALPDRSETQDVEGPQPPRSVTGSPPEG